MGAGEAEGAVLVAAVLVAAAADFTAVAEVSMVEPVLPEVVSVAEDWGAVHALLAEVSVVEPVDLAVVDLAAVDLEVVDLAVVDLAVVLRGPLWEVLPRLIMDSTVLARVRLFRKLDPIGERGEQSERGLAWGIAPVSTPVPEFQTALHNCRDCSQVTSETDYRTRGLAFRIVLRTDHRHLKTAVRT